VCADITPGSSRGIPSFSRTAASSSSAVMGRTRCRSKPEARTRSRMPCWLPHVRTTATRARSGIDLSSPNAEPFAEDEVGEKCVEAQAVRDGARLLARVGAHDLPAAIQERELEERRALTVVEHGEHDWSSNEAPHGSSTAEARAVPFPHDAIPGPASLDRRATSAHARPGPHDGPHPAARSTCRLTGPARST
jgi:hypothetical protein